MAGQISSLTNGRILNGILSTGRMLPCVTPPGETFSGIAAGVTALKVFPVEYITPAVTSVFSAVVPHDIVCLPVGGIQPGTAQMHCYIRAGANGFGPGDGVYQADMGMVLLRERAQAYQA